MSLFCSVFHYDFKYVERSIDLYVYHIETYTKKIVVRSINVYVYFVETYINTINIEHNTFIGL